MSKPQFLRTSRVRRVCSVVACILWSAAITVGTLYGYRYEMTPAETNTVEKQWPALSECELAADSPTLLMFVHPRCPCSRSSLSELAILLTHCPDHVNVQVVFIAPESVPKDWAETDLWESAANIPGVVRRLDRGGTEHRRFGASISGEVFLFLPTGNLVFHGGITSGRGHSGDNAGRSTLKAFLLHRRLPAMSSPVFGCELESSDSPSPDSPCCVGRKATP